MRMETIGGFLERYKNFVPPPLAAARAVRDAISEALGIEVAAEAIVVKNGSASVMTEALHKTEILLNKDRVLIAARTKIGDGVRDIR